MEKEKIKIISQDEETTNILHENFMLDYKGLKIEVFKETQFQSNIGEMGDTIDINCSERELTDEEEDIIKEFIEDI